MGAAVVRGRLIEAYPVQSGTYTDNDGNERPWSNLPVRVITDTGDIVDLKYPADTDISTFPKAGEELRAGIENLRRIARGVYTAKVARHAA